MGTTLPGAGTILMDEQLTFTAPVYAGDTITASIKLVHVEEKNAGTSENSQAPAKVRWNSSCKGTIHQLMMKTLFTYCRNIQNNQSLE